jgi:uncharacterized protein YjlB
MVSDTKQLEVGGIATMLSRALSDIASSSKIYWTVPNQHCPNSKLPVLVYRDVLPSDLSEDSVRDFVEANNWIYGGTFKHYGNAHYHSNTHECYAALKGSTKCLYGVGPLDNDDDGVVFSMKAGDIAVHAAGVSHRNVESSDGYTYMVSEAYLRCSK